MEAGIFALSALVALFGFLVIFFRTRSTQGLYAAFVMLGGFVLEICYLSYSRDGDLWVLKAALFFELVTVSAVIFFVVSLQARSMQANLFMIWLRRVSLSLSLCFGFILLCFPDMTITMILPQLVVTGPMGQIQSIMVICGAVFFMWIVENMIRAGNDNSLRIMRYPAIGIVVIGASFCLNAIYRLSTLTISSEVLGLSSLIMLCGFLLIIFFSVRYRLFEMNIFVSRYVVYHSVTLLAVGAYVLIMGLILVGVKRLGMEISFLFMGSAVFVVLLVLAFIAISPEVRSRIHFFVNTHFFANKYDYRKEWGDLSRDLSIAFDEKQIIDVTATLILDSMYVRELSIWLLDDDVYRCHFSFPSAMESTQILLDLPFIEYLEANPYFLRRMPCRAADPLWERLVEEHRGFLDQYHIELAVPMDVEKGIMGFICAGGQTAGNQYGQDDIDLLSSIAMQSAAAVMSARFAGELSDNRELDTINRVSAFVLHDLKNASGNLSLILQNAPDHMGDPEFVADMLDAMEGSLMRISKVIDRLGTRTLGDEVRKEDICIASFVKGIVQRLSPSLAGIHVILKIEDGLEVNSDPEVVERILENLILNAAQASLEGGEVVISAFSREEDVVYCVADNGPGMDEDFISRRLYRPFQTTKENGTGLGLWQVKQLSSHLGGAIEVENYPGLGVTIRVVLPAQPLS